MRATTFFLGALLVISGLALTPPASDAVFEPEWLWSDFMVTTASTSAQIAAQCTQQYPSSHTCVEWCDVYQGGIVVPRNRFCCEDDGDDVCTMPLN